MLVFYTLSAILISLLLTPFLTCGKFRVPEMLTLDLDKEPYVNMLIRSTILIIISCGCCVLKQNYLVINGILGEHASLCCCQLGCQMSTWERMGGSICAVGQGAQCFLLVPQPDVSVHPVLMPQTCEVNWIWHFIAKTGSTRAEMCFSHSSDPHNT